MSGLGMLLAFVCCVATAFTPVWGGLQTLLVSLGGAAARSLRKAARLPLLSAATLAVFLVGLALVRGAPSQGQGAPVGSVALQRPHLRAATQMETLVGAVDAGPVRLDRTERTQESAFSVHLSS